ncbi:hypothetical protein A6R68_04445, partial [Neotoma lepida]
MQTTDLGNKHSGKIWHRKPSPATHDGIIVNIVHSTSEYHPKTLRFLNVAFDGSGDSFIAGDHQGNIYAFDLHGNRFTLVQRTAQACTALAFSLRRKSEFLVALADYSIKCFDTVTKELVSWMRGHESSVCAISVHASGRYAITTSSDTAQLWDLDTFQRKRKLNIRQSVGIQKVFFLPFSNTILSCFKDNSIFAWECDTLFCKYQLPAPPEGSSILYKVLGVLSQDGIMRFVNIQTCKLLFEIGGVEEGISSSVISPHGRYIASIMENGSLNIYSVQALTQEINKPPPPLVKVIEDLPNNTLRPSNLKMKIMSGRVQRPARSQESKIQTRVLKQDLTGNLKDKENELSKGLNKKRLQILLKGYGEYPTKYSLVDKGTHVAYLNLQKKYPIKSRKLLRILQRTLSALAHWSAIFSDTPYLPLLAFPFVKLFQNNQLICFEVVATLIINWCQHWFEYFPNPPINILAMIENVLAFHDKELLQHFIDRDVTSQLYAWPLLETLFSEVLTREEWLRLFDNVFSNHPSFLLMTVYFFHHRNNLDINVVIREVYRLMETTPADIHPGSMLGAFAALTKGQYPIFNQYPKFIVDYQTQERERIRNDELDFLRERLAAVKRELKMKEICLQDAARRRLLKLQQDQREMELRRLEDEIERKNCRDSELLVVHTQHRAVRQAQMRDEEIAATTKALEMRQLELESQKRHYEKVEASSLWEELLSLSPCGLLICGLYCPSYLLWKQNIMSSRVDLTRSQDTIAKEIREDVDAHRRKVAQEEHMFQKLLETSQMGSRRTQRVIEDDLAKAEQACLNADWQIEALQKQKCDDLQRSRGYQESSSIATGHPRHPQVPQYHTGPVCFSTMKERSRGTKGAHSTQVVCFRFLMVFLPCCVQWKEAKEKEFHLQSEKKASALSDASRKWFLKETSAALEHGGEPLSQEPDKQQRRKESQLPCRTVSFQSFGVLFIFWNRPEEWGPSLSPGSSASSMAHPGEGTRTGELAQPVPETLLQAEERQCMSEQESIPEQLLETAADAHLASHPAVADAHTEVPWLQWEHMPSSSLSQTSQLNDISEVDPSAQNLNVLFCGRGSLSSPSSWSSPGPPACRAAGTTHTAAPLEFRLRLDNLHFRVVGRNQLSSAISSRKTTEWNHTEHDLLKKVRNLRQRLIAQARNRCQPPHLLTTPPITALSLAQCLLPSADSRQDCTAITAAGLPGGPFIPEGH